MRYGAGRPGVRLMMLVGMAVLAVQLAGCASLGRGGSRPRVEAFPNRYVAALEAGQVVQVLRRAEFSEREILEIGLDLRNALAVSGGARVFRNNRTVAIFVVHADYVHGASWERGSFIYSTLTGEFR